MKSMPTQRTKRGLLSTATIVGSLAFAVGCGTMRNPLKRDHSKDSEQAPRPDGAALTKYRLEDPSCVPGQGLKQVGVQSVTVWDQKNAVGPVDWDLSDATGESALSGGIVRGTFYGYHAKGGQALAAPHPVVICRSGQAYEHESIENVALTSFALLDQAYRFYAPLGTLAGPMPQLDLVILPTFENPDARNGIESDLLTAGGFEGRPAVIVYPTSTAMLPGSAPAKVNAWEIPFILAHEFGHRVLINEQGGLPNVSDGNLSTAMTYLVIQEGFADLFGFLALGGKSNAEDTIFRGGSLQAVDAADFHLGEDVAPKVLTDKLLECFQGSAEKTGCFPASRQLPQHYVGSVVAHGLNKMMETQGITAADAKAKVALAWAGSLQTETLSADLGPWILKGVQAVRQPAGTLEPASCDLVTSLFPAFAKAWQSSLPECSNVAP